MTHKQTTQSNKSWKATDNSFYEMFQYVQVFPLLWINTLKVRFFIINSCNTNAFWIESRDLSSCSTCSCTVQFTVRRVSHTFISHWFSTSKNIEISNLSARTKMMKLIFSKLQIANFFIFFSKLNKTCFEPELFLVKSALFLCCTYLLSFNK